MTCLPDELAGTALLPARAGAASRPNWRAASSRSGNGTSAGAARAAGAATTDDDRTGDGRPATESRRRRMKRIGVLTGGGDAAGMNAALRAVVRTAWRHGAEVIGINKGWLGLAEGTYQTMSPGSVSGILQKGGTILRTFRYPQFATAEGAAPVGAHAEEAEARRHGHHRRRRQLPRRRPSSRRNSAARASACRRPSTTTFPAPTTPSASTRR